MGRPASRALVAPFIKEFGLDASEFADPQESFKSFNEFFIRKLKPEARPFDPDPEAVTFPCDGRHLGFPNISEITSVFVKGQRFSLASLLGASELSNRFARGSLVLSRLCPTDYHRFHFPDSGRVLASWRIPGALHS
ncbi:MAG TPA: phosphatidylserine decarboxylase, partial [Verrucomicrobiales bacterium]|nr:phosphatidylserine decarboxylase [Verrucomicrobiales bacterium]